MKLIIVLAAVTLAQAAKLDNTYLPPNARSSGGSANFLQTPHAGSRGQNTNAYATNAFAQNDYARSLNNYNAYEARPERPQAAFEKNAAILRLDNLNEGERYSYAFETENGIYAEENGVATNGVQAQGGFTYTGDDGKVYSIKYTADENGFVPQGDHLPTPPPIPEEILKSLEQNARDEAAGIYDDGSYNAAKYNDNAQQYYAGVQPISYNADDTVVTNSAVSNNAQARTSSARNIQKAYLPPFAQRTAASTRQQTFSARDGYRY